MSESSSTGIPTLRLKTISWIVVAGLIVWAVFWIFVQEPEHDEVEHWHAAWLMSQGQQPYVDFFEHHCPQLWNLLRLYYVFCGDSFGIILSSRFCFLVIFAFTILLFYRISRRWTSPQGALVASIGFPLFNLSLLQAHLYVRGDPLILFLLVFSLWLAVPIVEKKRWTKDGYPGMFLIFLSLGLAVGFSPRAGISVITLYVLLFIFSFKKLPVHRLLAMFFLGGIIIIVPTLLQALVYGFQPFFFWVYGFSTALYPSFSPLNNLIKILISASPLWLLVVVFLYQFIRKSDLRKQMGIWLIFTLAVVNFIGLWAGNRPFIQHFLMTIPFFGFLAGIGYDRFIEGIHKRVKLPKLNYAGLLLLGGLILVGVRSYRLWTGGGLESRSYWQERAAWILEQADEGDTFAAGTAYFQPLFLDDSFYYWFAGTYITPTMRQLQPDFKPYTFHDLQTASPAVLHDSFAETWWINRSSGYRSWLEENYKPTPYPRYWIRKE